MKSTVLYGPGDVRFEEEPGRGAKLSVKFYMTAILFVGLNLMGSNVWARERFAPADASSVPVEVTGMQFAWYFRYPGPDGKFGIWEGTIWSDECSQRIADPYSFSHVAHGVIFYGLLWLVARRAPIRYRFLAAVLIEATWEALENSPIIIDRYRAVTISLGYVGDSVLNSTSDVLMMALGFLIASRLRPWTSVALVLTMELGMLVLCRDNLTLNIVMLVYPLEAIRQWQMAGRPPG
jgi:hypothetical protein